MKIKEITSYDYAFSLIKELSRFKIPEEKPELKINILDEDILKLTENFYKDYTPPKYYQAFISTLLMANINMLSTSSDICSGSFIKNSNNTCTITIYRNLIFDDILSLTHEFAHGINNILNPKIFQTKNIIAKETVATFFELLCAKYFQNENLEELTNPRLENIYRMHIKEAQKINTLIDENNNLDLKHTYQIAYIIAYVITINLLKIHEIDPDYSFYLLNNALNYNNNPDIITYYEYEELGLLNLDPIKEHHQNLVLRKKL